MKTVYIHIGSPKTGTSALQLFLLKNRERLELLGLDYPAHKTDKNMIASGNGVVLAMALKNGQIQEAAKVAEQLKKCIGTLILSSEYFMRLDKKYVFQLSELFPGAKIIVYVRRQADGLMAAYAQRVKRRNEPRSIEEYLSEGNQDLFSLACLEYYASAFGRDNVIVRPYEKTQFIGDNIFSDFLCQLGHQLSGEFWLPETRINTSYPRQLLEFKRILNHFRLEGNPFNEALQHCSDNCGLQFVWNCQLLSPAHQRKIDLRHEEQNMKVAERFLHRKDGRLFLEPSQDPDDEWKDFPGLTKLDVCVIADAMMKYDFKLACLFKEVISKGLKSSDQSLCEAAKVLKPILEMDNVKNADQFSISRLARQIQKKLLKKAWSGIMAVSGIKLRD